MSPDAARLLWAHQQLRNLHSVLASWPDLDPATKTRARLRRIRSNISRLDFVVCFLAEQLIAETCRTWKRPLPGVDQVVASRGGCPAQPSLAAQVSQWPTSVS
ncbi:MAG TPA: hypothetical protein PK306_05635 [Aquabacterium sp.]|nr:hypothetical protein [Aquabacterium sp.]